MINVYRLADFTNEDGGSGDRGDAAAAGGGGGGGSTVSNPLNNEDSATRSISNSRSPSVVSSAGGASVGTSSNSISSREGQSISSQIGSSSSSSSQQQGQGQQAANGSLEMKGRHLSLRIGGRGGYDQASTTLLGHEGFISGLTFLDNGTKILSASDDHTAAMWDLERGTCVEQFFGHTQGLTAISLCPTDGNVFATSSYDRSVKVRRWAKCKCRQVKTLFSSSPVTLVGGGSVYI